MAYSTGNAAILLGTTEPKLNDLIRRGEIKSPPVRAGRRQWERCHIVDAARRLGIDDLDDRLTKWEAGDDR